MEHGGEVQTMKYTDPSGVKKAKTTKKVFCSSVSQSIYVF